MLAIVQLRLLTESVLLLCMVSQVTYNNFLGIYAFNYKNCYTNYDGVKSVQYCVQCSKWAVLYLAVQHCSHNKPCLVEPEWAKCSIQEDPARGHLSRTIVSECAECDISRLLQLSVLDITVCILHFSIWLHFSR